MSRMDENRRNHLPRKAKTKAATEQLSLRKLKGGLLDATPTSHFQRTTERNAQESSLLRLPPEIRNRIWKEVVTIDTVHVGDAWNDGVRRAMPELRLLRVCRQIYAEAALLPYSVNRFFIYSTADSRSWLKQRAPSQKLEMQFIDIMCSRCEDTPLRSFPNLKMVRVQCICCGQHVEKPEEGIKVETRLREICQDATPAVQNIPG